MNSFFDKNIDAIKTTHGSDFFDTFSLNKINFEIEKTISGQDTLCFLNDEDKVYAHSKYDPQTIANKFIEGLEKNNNQSIFLLFGVGLGYEFIEVTKLKFVTEIIIIEKYKDVLFAFLDRVNLSLVKQKVVIIRNFEELYLYLSNKSSNLLDNTLEYFNNGYENFDKPFCEEIQKAYLAVKEDNQTNKNTAKRFAKSWFDCSVNNFTKFLNSKSLDKFYEINKGKTAIVVGAGPSLEKNIELLKDIKGKIFVFSTHTAYQKLIKHGIVPDAVCAVDSNQPLINEYKENGFDIPFFTSYHVPPEIFNYAKNDVFFIKNDTDGISSIVCRELNKNIKDVTLGGSVACVITSLLDEANFSKIILIGMDLAYTGGKTHVAGTFYGEKTSKSFDFDNGRTFIKSIDGGEVETSLTMKGYKEWFESYIKIKKVDIINATEGGALIEGTSNMTLRDAIDKYKCDEIFEIKGSSDLFTHEEKIKTYDILKKYRDELISIKNKPSIDKFDKPSMEMLGLMKDSVIYEVNEIVNKNTDKIYIDKMVRAIEYAIKGINKLLEEVKNETNNI